MVYIKYGPPDRIDDYVYGSATTGPPGRVAARRVFPTQYWEYRNIEGIGSDIELEFVDSTEGNLYTLEMDVNKKDILLRQLGRPDHGRAAQQPTWRTGSPAAWIPAIRRESVLQAAREGPPLRQMSCWPT